MESGRTRKLKAVFVISLYCLLAGCSGIRRVGPLEPGASAISLSLGGPVTEVAGKNVPLPFLSAGFNHGFNDLLGMEAGLNLTCALFGVLYIDGGINWNPLRSRGGVVPGVAVTPKINLMTNFENGGTRLFPALNPLLYWTHGRHSWYAGSENWFDLARIRSDGNGQRFHLFFTPFLGYGISWRRWQLQLECRLYVPNIDNTFGPLVNTGIGNYGIIGPFFGISRTFGENSI